MVKRWIQLRERQLKDQPVKKERRTVSMNKLRTVFAVWMMALTITALAAVPLQTIAQVNTYDDSFDAIAQRHGYYRALVAATTNGAEPIAQNDIDLARGAEADVARWVAQGEYYTGLARGAEAETARWVAMGEFYTKVDTYDVSKTFDQVAQRHGYYRAFVAATLPKVDAVVQANVDSQP
jgi:hypothetical protein